MRCLERSRAMRQPFRHWRLHDVFPKDVCAGLLALPFAAPEITDTEGRRETHNATRVFFGPRICRDHPVCREIAHGLREPAVVGEIERICGIDLGGSFLRVEYCQDRGGFWLEPHTDIGAKLLTLQVYLSRHPDALAWGTDLLDGARNLITTVPAVFNSALMFVPGSDTWHGFRQRPIHGVRRSVIVNYVKDEWRSRHELVDPRQPVPSAAVRARS
ncbi:MAG: 2OG-Fe(II) oxygenase [Geminicoccaceae bacterium]